MSSSIGSTVAPPNQRHVAFVNTLVVPFTMYFIGFTVNAEILMDLEPCSLQGVYRLVRENVLKRNH